MIAPGDVAAVIVTRGDVPLDEILDSLPPFGQVIVWKNGRGCSVEWADGSFFWEQGALDLESFDVVFPDLSVYGRYAAMSRAALPVVYVQDDDCLVSDIEGLLARYEPGMIAANMPESRWADYPDSCLVGWGAVFDRDLPEVAFERAGFNPRCSPFIDDDWERLEVKLRGAQWSFPDAQAVRRDCDVLFTALTSHQKFDLGFKHLPWAETPGRLFKQPGHAEARARMLATARTIRAAG